MMVNTVCTIGWVLIFLDDSFSLSDQFSKYWHGLILDITAAGQQFRIIFKLQFIMEQLDSRS